MHVKEIVIEWLETHGYDGFVNNDEPCGCGIDDLAPCQDYESNIPCECEPAYKITGNCKSCTHPCDFCGEKDAYCFTTRKSDIKADCARGVQDCLACTDEQCCDKLNIDQLTGKEPQAPGKEVKP